MRSVADMKKGEKSIIRSFTNLHLSLRLLEMGCLPGSEITLDFIAPLGDPIGVKLQSSMLSMRKAEAATILVD